MSRALFKAVALALVACSASAAPSLDPTNAQQLQAAASQALQNLFGYYTPSEQGVFDQVQTPWHASGMIWGMFMDYQKWTGDNQFASQVTGALVNLSYGTWQDILGGPLTTTNEKILGKWNDDILWPAIAFTGGAEVYGASSAVPGSNGAWSVVPQRTLAETWDYEDSKCGGGIYWSRNPQASGGTYKSSITNVEFLQCAARLNLLTGNATILSQAQELWDWMYAANLIQSDGTVMDGFNVDQCNPVNSAFTYNYGLAFGGAAWMHYQTKNQTWLDLAGTIFTKSMGIFFTTDSLMELCEQTQNCGRDSQDFKAVYLRNLAYLYRETKDQSVKSNILKVIDSSLTSMVSRACDDNWNCNGNWTSGSQPIKYVRSQHVASSLLVAALGIHQQITGTGLMPKIDGGQLNTTGSSTAGQSTTNQGSITTVSLDAAPSLRSALPLMLAALVAGLGLSVVL